METKTLIYIGVAAAAIILVLWLILREEEPHPTPSPPRGDSPQQPPTPPTPAQLVLFKRDGCPHCVSLKPTWETLVQKYGPGSSSPAGVDFKVIDTDSVDPEDLQKHSIQGVPSIRYYPKGISSPDEYIPFNGARNMESLERFIFSKGKVNS